jgi:hypothetical protein
LHRKPDAVRLALVGMELQARGVMIKQAGSEFAQEARRSHVGSVMQGTDDAVSHMPAGRANVIAGCQTQSSWLWKAGGSRRSQSCARRQLQKLRRKPDAVKLDLEGGEPQAQAVISRPAGADFCTGTETHSIGL